MNNPYPLDTTSDMPPQMPGSSSPAHCSAAVLKAEIDAWKKSVDGCVMVYTLRSGALTELLRLMEKMCDVIETLERRMPPNNTV